MGDQGGRRFEPAAGGSNRGSNRQLAAIRRTAVRTAVDARIVGLWGGGWCVGGWVGSRTSEVLYYSLSGALLRFTFVVQLLPGQPAGRPPARRRGTMGPWAGPGTMAPLDPGPSLRAGGRPAGWPGNSWTTKVNRNRAPERE